MSFSYFKINDSQVLNHHYVLKASCGAGCDGVFMNAGADSCI